MDVEGEVDVDVGILDDVKRLGDVYRRVVTGDGAFTEVPPESIAALTEVPTEFAEPEFADPEFADFNASSPFLFPVLRLSGADS